MLLLIKFWYLSLLTFSYLQVVSYVKTKACFAHEIKKNSKLLKFPYKPE